MRVLVVTLGYPPDGIGGYEVMAGSVCERLARRGHDVMVACAGSGSPSTRRGVQVRRVFASYWDGSDNIFPSLEQAVELERANRDAFARAVAEHRPDVISYWHMGSLSLGLISAGAERALPMTFVVGDDWLVYGDWADGWLRRFRDDHDPASREQVAAATGLPTVPPDVAHLGVVCFVSQHTRDRAVAHGIDPPRWCLAPPGVDRAMFEVAFDRPWAGELLWVGRVTERKGIITAVRALDLLAEMSLRVVGPVDPAVRPALDEALNANGARSRVTFDVIPHEQIARAYQVADATLFTSENESEAFGLVPLESMACGTPVVSTAIGGSAEYCLDGENCLIVPPGDADALAGAVRRLIEPDLRLQLSVGGVRTASVLSADTQAWIIERAMYAALDPTP